MADVKAAAVAVAVRDAALATGPTPPAVVAAAAALLSAATAFTDPGSCAEPDTLFQRGPPRSDERRAHRCLITTL